MASPTCNWRRVISNMTTGGSPCSAGSSDELFLGAFEHVEHGIGERAETAAFEKHGLFLKQFAGDDGLTIGGEHRGFRQPLLD